MKFCNSNLFVAIACNLALTAELLNNGLLIKSWMNANNCLLPLSGC